MKKVTLISEINTLAQYQWIHGGEQAYRAREEAAHDFFCNCEDCQQERWQEDLDDGHGLCCNCLDCAPPWEDD